ncbi:hypothetical protein [Vulgatibacter sp.]|uniref:hypothetical protein n=1 Tax=Vulgatibacter sp. TaxID=1971226 RepID=UPI003567D8B8
MSQLLKIVLTAVAVIVVSVMAINKYNDTVETYEYKLARADIRADYLERSATVRAIQDPVRYEEEARGLFKWYLGELTELYNRYPAHKNTEDGYLAELEARKAAGQLDGEEFEAYKASYDQVKEIWDLVKAGRYSPALTAADGAMRIDFLEFEPTTIDGEKGVKGRFVLWGAQRRKLEEKSSNGVVSYRYDVQAAFQDVQLKLAGKDGKPVAEASFGLPSGPYVPFPEQKLADFPPMAYIGSFAFPVLPNQATQAEIESVVVSRSATGRDIEARFAWKKEVPSEWKLAEGETWSGADVEEREELAR